MHLQTNLSWDTFPIWIFNFTPFFAVWAAEKKIQIPLNPHKTFLIKFLNFVFRFFLAKNMLPEEFQICEQVFVDSGNLLSRSLGLLCCSCYLPHNTQCSFLPLELEKDINFFFEKKALFPWYCGALSIYCILTFCSFFLLKFFFIRRVLNHLLTFPCKEI